MSTCIDPTFVILGANLRDCQAEAQRLWAEEPERLMGHRVKAVSAATTSALLGLRVHDYSITNQARMRGCDEAANVLNRSSLLTNKEAKQS